MLPCLSKTPTKPFDFNPVLHISVNKKNQEISKLKLTSLRLREKLTVPSLLWTNFLMFHAKSLCLQTLLLLRKVVKRLPVMDIVYKKNVGGWGKGFIPEH